MGSSYYFMRFPRGKTKAVTLSYDDGVEQDEELIRLMEQYGFKGAFNLNYGRIAPEGKTYEPGQIHRRLSLSGIKRIHSSENVEVACHGLKHLHMEWLLGTKLMYEIAEDRKGLENVFGRVIRGMAYPFGTYNDKVVEVLRLAGISYARTVKVTKSFDLPTDWLRLSATCKHTDPHLMELAEKFSTMEVKSEPKLFYLWGHSYEFERDDNWDVIENFFKRMAGLPDVWYATNIEIYDYVQAFERLNYSCDGNRVYNPSGIDVWLGNTEKVICVPAGKTVEL